MPRKPENKDVVLLALYSEYTKDIGDFDRIRAATLDMDSKEFLWAMMKLQAEGLISGFTWIPPGEMNPTNVRAANRKYLALTATGVTASEEMLELAGKAQTEKLLKLAEFFGKLGFEILKTGLLKMLD